MLFIFHWFTLIFYWTAPIVAGIVAAARGRQRQGQSIITYLTALVAGAMMGTSLTVLHARDVNGRASLGQFLMAIYFATGVMLALKIFDALLKRALRRRKFSTGGMRPLIVTVVRGFALIVLGLPYVVSAVMIYRPKAEPMTNPMAELRTAFHDVQFESTDGLRLAGWWIPAQTVPRGRFDRTQISSTKTVIICHGWGENKSTQLVLARQMVAAGYNALIFDFRGHGESEGQVTTLGDLERRDVLGAVRWLRQSYPAESKRIFGMGVSIGGAALIAAAADKSTEGQAIEALAVYGTYDDLASLARTLAHGHFSAPMDSIVSWLGLGLASVQSGSNLADFKPARLVHDIWPRPILVIHATYDTQVPFDHGDRLFQAASYPKQALWLPHEYGDEALRDESAATVVREFFENARSIPVI